MGKWKKIDDDARRIVRESDGGAYGRYILAYPISGEVTRVRWWQTTRGDERDKSRFRNFLGDCGNAYHPTHYMEMPKEPKE